MDRWKLVHRYNRLIAIGEARPFLCPECNERLIFIPDTEAEPVMYCCFDSNAYVPGTQFWADVNAVVTEYYLDA